MKNVNQNDKVLYTSKRSFIKELYHNFIIFKVENKSTILKAMFGIYLICGIMVSGLISTKAYAYMNRNTISNTVQAKQNIEEWKRVADLDSSKTVMMYKVDINDNDKILDTVSYRDCIYRDDSNAWYCPVDLYQEEIDHINSVNSKDNNDSVVPSTPYFSHVGKILKADYVK
jgi:hypothetical protein